MITISIPLWMAIAFVVLLSIIAIYFIIGDFIAKVFYKKLKAEQDKWATKILTEDKGEILPLDEKEKNDE